MIITPVLERRGKTPRRRYEVIVTIIPATHRPRASPSVATHGVPPGRGAAPESKARAEDEGDHLRHNASNADARARASPRKRRRARRFVDIRSAVARVELAVTAA